MVRKTPLEKAIKYIQANYSDNNSKEISLTKSQIDEMLFDSIGINYPLIRNARQRLIEEELITWPFKSNQCVLYLEKIKQR